MRELTRVAVAYTEQKWLEACRGKTLRQIEELVAGRMLGDEPSAPPSPLAARHVLRFEVAGETFALFREAMAELRRQLGVGDDDSALLALARLVLGGPRDDGRASYQVAINLYERCGAAAQLGNGQLVSVGAEVVEMARCDAQHVGTVAPPAANQNTVSPPSAHVGTPAMDGGDDVEDAALHDHAGPFRATQTIPPAVRRTALRRDHQRCRVPGCKNAIFLDLHHLTGPRRRRGATR